MRQTEKKHKILESTSISQECDNNILQGKKEVQQNVQQTEKKRRLGPRYSMYGYLFVAPFFIIFLIFQLYPLVYSVYLGFTDFAGLGKDVSFTWENYAELFEDTRFWYSIYNTFLIWIINFIPQIVFAFLFAAIFTSVRLKMRGSGAFKVIYFLPNILTATSVAVLFASMFTFKTGILDQILKATGIISDPNYDLSSDPTGARIVVAFIQFWRYFGSTMLTLAAGMLGINPTLYEAATVDGASKSRMFFSITLPLIRPIVLYTLVTSLLGGLQMFDIPQLFLNGGPEMAGGGKFATETVAVYIYKLAFEGDRLIGYASAASVYLFIIAAVLSVLTFRMFRTKREGQDGLSKKESKAKRSAGRGVQSV